MADDDMMMKRFDPGEAVVLGMPAMVPCHACGYQMPASAAGALQCPNCQAPRLDRIVPPADERKAA